MTMSDDKSNVSDSAALPEENGHGPEANLNKTEVATMSKKPNVNESGEETGSGGAVILSMTENGELVIQNDELTGEYIVPYR